LLGKILILFFLFATTNIFAESFLFVDVDTINYKGNRKYEGVDMSEKITPEEIVQKQDDAYNAGDIDAFMSFYHPEVKIYTYPNKLMYAGKEKMRKRYSKLFIKYPNNHAEIISRMSIGKYVIDKEKVTGREPGEIKYVIAIYEIKDNLIYKVWFMK